MSDAEEIERGEVRRVEGGVPAKLRRLEAMDWFQAEKEYQDGLIKDNPIPQMFEESAERHATKTAQLYKSGIYDRSLKGTVIHEGVPGEYVSLTYSEMQDIVHNLAAGFHELGIRHGDPVGIFSSSRMEWAQCDFALMATGGAVTTVYTSSSPRQVRYILGNSGAKGVVVENQELLERVLEVEDDLEIEFIVSIDNISEKYKELPGIYTLEDVYVGGAELYEKDRYQSWIDDIQKDDLASIVYTSGTTGQPKGVQLTHQNFRSNINQLRKRYGPRPDKDEDVVVLDDDILILSFLPLAHVFERLVGHLYAFGGGAKVAYAESVDTLSEDIEKVQPDGTTGVPRVYEKIYDRMREEASESEVKKRVFDWAVKVGKEYYEADTPGLSLRLQHGIASRLVYKQVSDGLGGEIQGFVSGGGTLSEELCKLYQAMELPIFEGYGLTETAPVVSANPVEEPKPGTVGPPLVDVEVKLDKSIASESRQQEVDGDIGELLVRGPNVTRGYYNKPEETADAFTEDGWLRTGDIVEIGDDGYLKFHDRVKQILVLSTGKNVAPEPIEDNFATSDIVEQCMVLGDGRKFVSALIVPNFDAVKQWAEKEDIVLPDLRLPLAKKAVCENDEVRDRVWGEIENVNRGLENHETIKKFKLVPEEFTEQNDLLTPTLKKKRRNILDKYDVEIEDMYSENPKEASEIPD